MIKELSIKLNPRLIKEGVFYPCPYKKDIECTIVLEEINEKARFSQEHLNNQGKVLGFRAHHKLTGNPYSYRAEISKQIGNPMIHVILDNNEPVDYATNLEQALNKAHEYLSNKIIKMVLEPHIEALYNNFLDTTKIGKEKFNKANLSEQTPQKTKK